MNKYGIYGPQPSYFFPGNQQSIIRLFSFIEILIYEKNLIKNLRCKIANKYPEI